MQGAAVQAGVEARPAAQASARRDGARNAAAHAAQQGRRCGGGAAQQSERRVHLPYVTHPDGLICSLAKSAPTENSDATRA